MSADPPSGSGAPGRARGERGIPPRSPRAVRRPPPGARRDRPSERRSEDDGLERLQKVLAAAGLGSRRACEELITTGRVEVDRKVVTQLGTRVDPRRQEIRVDGERLPDPKRVVYMLFKPVGVVTTNYDPDGRPRVIDLVPGEQRLFAIGRLDRMSEGLILVTNDGALANLLAHPRYGVEKRYLVQVAGVPTPETLEKLRRGIGLAEGMARAQHVNLKSQHKQSAVLEMVLDEGKNREIRRMLAQLGHKVHQLKRVAVGTLSLGSLLPGQCRPLTWTEVESLRRDALAQTGGAGLEGPPARRPPRGGGPGRPAGRGGALGRPPRGAAGGGGGGRPPRPPFLDRSGTDGARGGQGRGRGDADGPRPPRPGKPRRPPIAPGGTTGPATLPGGRRRRPGKASTWRKKRDT